MQRVAAEGKEARGGELGTREHKKLLTRDALHDAAMRLSMRYGYEAVTIEQICDAAGVSARTFFNYYPSKAAAVIGIIVADATPEQRRHFIECDKALMPAICALFADCIVILPRGSGFHEFAKLQHDAFFALGLQIRETRQSLTGLVEERTGSRQTAELAIELAVAALKVSLRRTNPHTREELEQALLRTVAGFATLCGGMAKPQ